MRDGGLGRCQFDREIQRNSGDAAARQIGDNGGDTRMPLLSIVIARGPFRVPIYQSFCFLSSGFFGVVGLGLDSAPVFDFSTSRVCLGFGCHAWGCRWLGCVEVTGRW